MKEIITLDPGHQDTVLFSVSPSEPDTYSVSIGDLNKEFTALSTPLATLSGKVRDSNTNIQIILAQVRLSDGIARDTTYTNTLGYFIIGNKEPGQYTLTISKEGYETKSFTVNLQSGDNNIGDIFLVPYEAEFQITDLTINPSEQYVGYPVEISVTVKNIGDAPGTVTVGYPDCDIPLIIDPPSYTAARYLHVAPTADFIGTVFQAMMGMITITMMVRLIGRMQ